MTDQTAKPAKPAAVPGLTKTEALRALMYCGGLDPDAEAANKMPPGLLQACLALRAAGLAEDCLEGLEPRFILSAAGLERLAALDLPVMPARVIAATARQGHDDVCDRSEDQAAQDAHARKWLTAWGASTGISRVFQDDLPDRTVAARIWNRRLHRLTAQRGLWAQVTIVTGLLLAERDADALTGNRVDTTTPLDPAELIRQTYLGDESAAWGLGGLLGVDVPADLREQKERIVAVVRERLIRHGLGLDVDAELGPAVEGIRAKLAERDTLAAQAELSLAQRDEARRERGVAEAERDAALGREAKALLDREAHRRVALDMGRERDQARKELADERAEVARLRAELTRIEDERRAEQAERDMRGGK